MFGFFKKKVLAKTEINNELSTAEKEQVAAEITKLQEKTLADSLEASELAALYEQIGLKQALLYNSDQAIEALEKSLANKKSIGAGYKQLMRLYNQKRGEAAKKGDDSGIDYYMEKMDEMRQIAKKLTISGE